MEWKPSRENKIPLYRQISNYFEIRILNGEFPQGSRLPSERELAEIWKINRSTINSAFEELRSTGLVSRTVGQGTIVNEKLLDGKQKRILNWDHYVSEGFYQPNNPLNQQIFQFIRSEANIINFAIGELASDLLPVHLMEEVQNSIKLESNLGYEQVQGSLKLRQVISDHLKKYRKIDTTPSSILVTSGAQQAIHLIIRSLLKPGDSVAIENPSYAFSLPIFHSRGLKTYFLSVQDKGIDPEQINFLYKKHRIKMVFLNPIFQNPTGTTLAIEKRKRVLEICTKLGIPIVEDDPYSIINYSNQPVQSLKTLDTEGMVLYVSSLSKVVSSGLRVGWIAGPQSVIDRLTDMKQQIDFGLSPFPQSIAANLLNSVHFEDHIHNLKQKLKLKRDLTIEALRNQLGDKVSFFIPEGGIHLWCKINDLEVNMESLFKDSIKNGVIFTPGSTLTSEHNFARLTYGRVDSDSIQEGIRRFAQSLVQE